MLSGCGSVFENPVSVQGKVSGWDTAWCRLAGLSPGALKGCCHVGSAGVGLSCAQVVIVKKK